jgi:hypothetical protein
VEEEKSAKLILDLLKLVEDRGSAILILDRELGARNGGEGEGMELEETRRRNRWGTRAISYDCVSSIVW